MHGGLAAFPGHSNKARQHVFCYICPEALKEWTGLFLHARRWTNVSRKPNLFDFASKELSQDAVICWLISWAGTEAETDFEQALRDVGYAFVDALLAKHGAALKGNVTCPEIHQQDLGIDVLARVRDEDTSHVLLIEDKTYTDQHSGQLERCYREVVGGRSKLHEICGSSIRPIFLKTGNQSRNKDKRIEQGSKYKLFGRRDFLDVLDRYPGDNAIVRDFRQHLRQRETEFSGFHDWHQNENRRNWSWDAWEGLFRSLEGRIDADADWGYVSNRSGGFLGLWWHWVNTKEGDTLYLQLEIKPGNPEKQKLCFRVERRDDDTHEVREKYHKAILAAGGGRVERPSRMRVGGTMAVGRWKGDWLAFSAGARLDISGAVRNLKEAERIIDAAARSA